MEPPKVYTITDPETGEDIDFDWLDAAEPTEADQEQVLAAHRAQKPRSTADIARATKIPGAMGATIGDAEGAVVGAGKGIAQMITGAGDMIRRAAPWTAAADVDTGGSREALQPEGAAQKVGSFVGRAALSAVPGVRAAQGAAALTAGAPLAAQVAAQAAAGAGTNVLVGQTQGSTTPGRDAAFGAAGGAAGAVIPAAAKVATGVGRTMVRAGLKPSLTLLKQQRGASGKALDDIAEESVDTILQHRLTSPQKATDVISAIDDEIEALINASSAKTNGYALVEKRLAELERSAKANLSDPGEVLAAIAEKRAGLQGGNLFKDKATVVQGANGVSQVTMSRVPRTDVTARQLRDTAVADAKMNKTSTKWGGNAGPSGEVAKTAESAKRQGVRDLVPDVGPKLDAQGKVLAVRPMLDRQAVREANREALPPFAAAALSSGTLKGEILGSAMLLLRSGQLKTGVTLDRLAKAVQAEDAVTAGQILRSLGVTIGSGTTPAEVPQEGAMTITGIGRVPPKNGGGR